MKTIIFFVSLFLATLGFAQVPYVVNKNGKETNITQYGTTTAEKVVATNIAGTFNGNGLGVTNTYGRDATTNILVNPLPFVLSSSDWNPIVVSGAGTAGANGSYYQAITNSGIGNAGYGVWTNSSGGDFCIQFNNTNWVPSTLFSNFWTLQDKEDVNFYYDTLSTVPFGYWEISAFGGTPGASPVPRFGPALPTLITALASAPTNAVVTLSPGYYDLGGYWLKPTNITMIAWGAVVRGKNGLDGVVHPYGGFNLYGGDFASTNQLNVQSVGSFILDNCDQLKVRGASFSGVIDGIHGSMPAGSIFDFEGSVFSYWDGIVVTSSGDGMALVKNVNVRCVGIDLGQGTNSLHGISFQGFKTQRIIGCDVVLTNGAPAGTPGGILNNAASDVTDILGTSIDTRSPLGVTPKLRSAGTMNVFGVNLTAASDLVGVVNFIGSANTNIFGASNYFSTVLNGANVTAGTLTNRASSGRIQITDSNGKIISATASGAVPIDADGTATTWGQIDTLSMAAGSNSLPYVVAQGYGATTNLIVAGTVNLTNALSILVTNASFTWGQPINPDASGKTYQPPTVVVSNSANTAIVMTLPAGWTYGINSTNGVLAGGVTAMTWARVPTIISNVTSVQWR